MIKTYLIAASLNTDKGRAIVKRYYEAEVPSEAFQQGLQDKTWDMDASTCIVVTEKN